MKRYLIIFSLTLLGLSCRKDVAINICGQRSYFYQGHKIYLTELNNKMTISFTDSTTAQNKVNILSQFSYLNSIESSVESPNENYVIVSFKNFTDCQTANSRIAQLKSNPKIIMANLLLTYKNQGIEGIVGLTNLFIVKLKTSSTKQDLDQFALQTHTSVIGRPPFGIDTLTYIINADKYSNGDALDMANWFYLTDKFEYSEPNFIVLQ